MIINRKREMFFACLSVVLFIVSASFAQAGDKNKLPPGDEKILVDVCGKKITVGEFVKRAELTPRPPYAKGNSEAAKNIVLNSLVAEKLIAFDKEKETELKRDKRFKNFIAGRKEQTMREILYRETAFDKAAVDSSTAKTETKKSFISFRVKYFSVPFMETADEIKRNMVLPGNSFEQIFSELTGKENLPEKILTYEKVGNDMIRKTIYGKNEIKVNEIVGPVAVEGGYLFMKIIEKSEEKPISELDYARRFQKITDGMKKEQADKMYAEFIKNLMKGKKIDFNNETFFELTKILTPIYVGKKERDNIVMEFPPNEAKSKTERNLSELESLGNHMFFTVDGKKWTVEYFMNEIEKHPLVFKKSGFSEKEFPGLFRLAVADLVRDKYLTEAAYKKKLDERDEVKREAEIWKDAAIALYESGKITSGSEAGKVSPALSAYVAELLKKYKSRIKLNRAEFEKIKLTKVDLFAVKKSAPFPAVVPPFPPLSERSKVDY